MSLKIDKIEQYFIKNGYPEGVIEFKPGMKVFDSEMFVTGCLRILRAHPGNAGYYAYYNLLNEFYQKIKTL
jgi:hypothetical protein